MLVKVAIFATSFFTIANAGLGLCDPRQIHPASALLLRACRWAKPQFRRKMSSHINCIARQIQLTDRRYVELNLILRKMRVMKISRRIALIIIWCTTLTMSVQNFSLLAAAELDVWIGTGNPRGAAAGIYHLTFDDKSGKLSAPQLMVERSDTGFLAMHPSLDVLYSTGAKLSAWRIIRNKERVRLELLNEQPVGSGNATHVAVDRTGRVLLSAQYGSGTVCSFPLKDDGSIGEIASDIKQEEFSNVVPDRQDACHPHWIGTSPDNRFVLVPDLGADKIFVYRLDSTAGKLTRHGAAATPPGGGARHFKFHPSLPVGYVVNELTMSVSVMAYDSEAGELELAQTIPTLSDEQIAGEPFNSGSEVRVHPSGRFLYSGNRGHDSITAFSIDQTTGKLSLIEQESIRGCWPRNFNLDPSGNWLLAAGALSNTLAVFKIDQQTGALQYARSIQSVPAPICVLIAPKPDKN